MRLRTASLGLKLNLALLLFFLALGAATTAIVVYGFNRTQDNANARSEQALEELGKLALRAFVGGATENGGVQFESASEIGQRAARQMESFRRTGATIPVDTSGLTRTEGGLTYDPDPARTSDLILLRYASLDDAAVRDEIAYSAALDTIFESLFESFEEEVGGRNFDPNAIGFIGANGTGRYYPPRGIHEVIPPDLDITDLLERDGPVGNPTRRTTWDGPYEDVVGQGLVVTANSPVYEGDTYRGVIQVDLLIDRLVTQIDSIHPTPGGFAFYLDSQGDLLHTSAYELLTRESEGNDDLAAVLAGMNAGDGESEPVVEPATLGGEDFFIAYAPMPSLGGSFAVAAPVSEITAEAEAITAGIDEQGTRTLWAMLVAMGALFLAGLAGAGYLNRRVLLQPIGELLHGASAVGSGDLDTAIAVRSRDELGALAEGFNQMTENLRETEGRYRRVFESASDGLTISRLDGTVVEANAAACAMHGYTREEFLNLPISAHVHPDYRDLRQQFIEEIRQGRPYSVRALDVRKDGSSFDVDVRGVPFEFHGEPHVLSILRDVTAEVSQEQLLEERVEERTRELQTLLDVSRDVASTLDLQELATRILDQLRIVIAYDGAGVLLLEGDDLVVLEARDAAGTRDESMAGRRFASPVPGPAGEALERRASVLVEDVQADPALAAGQRDVPGPASTGRSWLAVPLIAQDRLLGVLTLWSAAPGVYGPQHADLALAVASQAAVAIENARLFEQVSAVAALEERQRLARELHDSVSQALYGIALGAQTARQLLDDDAEAVQPVEYVLSLAEAGLAEMRALIFELRPESLATEGLVSALEKQAAATRARYNLAVNTALPAEPEVSLSVKEALYRVAQEALHNTVKHARASTITLGLSTDSPALRLEISDDGLGFDPNGDFPGHLGLRSMRERIEAVGGTIEIDSRPGSGTRVAATVPR